MRLSRNGGGRLGPEVEMKSIVDGGGVLGADAGTEVLSEEAPIDILIYQLLTYKPTKIVPTIDATQVSFEW